MADDIRELQELIEQASQAIGKIGPSETRLMNRDVREGLESFMLMARKVVVALELARQADAQQTQEVAVVPQPGTVTLVTFYHADDCPTSTTQQGIDCTCEPEVSQEVVNPQAPDDEWSATHPMVLTANPQTEPPAMCPQKKNGVPCARELHNVGLHTPDAYPADASWTDKESD